MIRQVTAQPFMIPVILILFFLQAAVEDLGWRGYMQEELLGAWSPVQSALLIGVFHAFWHLPFFFIVGTEQIKMGLGFNFWLFVVQVLSFSVFTTWCYLDNHHSTLAAILLHTVGNLCNNIFVLPVGNVKFLLQTLLMVLVAVIVGFAFLKERKEVRHIRQLTP
jgi:membrane protease YdiL (CAAX protease family)